MATSPFVSRRLLLTGLAGVGAWAGLRPSLPRWSRTARAEADGPRLLVSLACFGGASQLDAFAPLDLSETVDTERGRLISYGTARPSGSALRAVGRPVLQDFLRAHHPELALVAFRATSTNHQIAQQRALTGELANNGRTLAEACAAVHGVGLPLPNVAMGWTEGIQHDEDATLDQTYAPDFVSDPMRFPLSTSAWRGVVPVADPLAGGEVARELVEEARWARSELEAASPFARTFANSQRRSRLITKREVQEPLMEAWDLITGLSYGSDADGLPFERYGLATSPLADLLEEHLPKAWARNTSSGSPDTLQAACAIAWLLLANGASASVTINEPGELGFLLFDEAHNDHRATQATRWDRQIDIADRFIRLMKATEWQESGSSLWDRTLLVLPTEFGRDKWLAADEAGTGHHDNNAMMVVSPLVRGNQSLGEVDPRNGLICGFDPETGEPRPFQTLDALGDPVADDPGHPDTADLLYGGLADIMGVSFEGQRFLPALRKG